MNFTRNDFKGLENTPERVKRQEVKTWKDTGALGSEAGSVR